MIRNHCLLYLSLAVRDMNLVESISISSIPKNSSWIRLVRFTSNNNFTEQTLLYEFSNMLKSSSTMGIASNKFICSRPFVCQKNFILWLTLHALAIFSNGSMIVFDVLSILASYFNQYSGLIIFFECYNSVKSKNLQNTIVCHCS